MNRLFSPILTFLQSSFLALTKADGKPGLSVDDFNIILSWVLTASREFTDAKSGQQRAEYVREMLLRVFGGRVPSWTADILVYLAYAWAKRKGWIS
jgi:hypothetical protein